MFIADPLELHFVRAWKCSQQDAAALADQHGDQHGACKLLLNLTNTSLNIPMGNENKDLDMWYTTIENLSYLFITLSCTEAMQSLISHFNQYNLVDPSWGNISSWVWQRVSHWFNYDAAVDTNVILEIEFHENDNIFISNPDKHKRNWKIVSTINVTYEPIQINWARNKASNYFNQHQPASSFTTVSNVMVLLCEVRHQ